MDDSQRWGEVWKNDFDREMQVYKELFSRSITLFKIEVHITNLKIYKSPIFELKVMLHTAALTESLKGWQREPIGSFARQARLWRLSPMKAAVHERSILGLR
jgi:hypothetical protein